MTRGFAAGLMTIALALPAAGCAAPANDSADATDAPVAAPAEMSTDTRYPALYRELMLPEPPDAEVMSTGRQDTSLRDGLSLRVTTPMNVQAARDYFSQALEAEGWTVDASRPLPGINVANVTGRKGDVTYTATLTANDNVTDINISIVQN